MTDLIDNASASGSASAPHVEAPIAPLRPNDNRYLAGNMAPVEREVTAFDLPVTGQIPAELEGRWLRNGPNPTGGPDARPRALVRRLRHGPRRAAARRHTPSGTATATSCPVATAARTPTSAASPARRGRWSRPVRRPSRCPTNSTRSGSIASVTRCRARSAPIPKYDPSTGELHAIAYHWPDLMDHVQYVVVGSSGLVTKVVDIPVPDMPMIHDMSLTATYAIVYDLPVTVDFDAVMAGSTLPVRLEARAGRHGSGCCPATAPPTRSSGATSTRASCSTRSTRTTPATERSSSTSAATTR